MHPSLRASSNCAVCSSDSSSRRMASVAVACAHRCFFAYITFTLGSCFSQGHCCHCVCSSSDQLAMCTCCTALPCLRVDSQQLGWAGACFATTHQHADAAAISKLAGRAGCPASSSPCLVLSCLALCVYAPVTPLSLCIYPRCLFIPALLLHCLVLD